MDEIEEEKEQNKFKPENRRRKFSYVSFVN